MSLRSEIDIIPYEKRVKLHKELEIKLESKYGSKVDFIYPYRIESDDIFLPFAYGVSIGLPRPPRTNYSLITVKFKGSLRPEQQKVKNEAIPVLSKTGSIILSMYCGFGKTITCLSTACTIGMTGLIIANKLCLLKQWKNAIKEFCPDARIQILSPGDKMIEADFYIVNAINVQKGCEAPGKNKWDFSKIGCLMIDEVHLIMAEVLSKSLTFIQPRYLIGLSATPYRSDGLDNLLNFYFGTYKIERKLFRPHLVYEVNTGFSPTVENSKTGRINWGLVLESQAMDENRNKIILDIVERFKDRVFLIMVKRVEQGKYLLCKLRENGQSVTSLLGSERKYDKQARVLIGTTQKIGTGFDHPRIDALILGGDVEEYFIQFLGRACRTQEVRPIVFDLVDKNYILKKHYATRTSVYLEHGGKIEKLKM